MDWNAMRLYEVEELIFTLTSAQTKTKHLYLCSPSILKKNTFITHEKVSKNFQRTILLVKLFISYLIMSISPIKKKKKKSLCLCIH